MSAEPLIHDEDHPRCASCRWFGGRWEDDQSCRMIADWANGGGESIPAEFASRSLAEAVDTEQYCAWVRVDPEFYCAHWTPIPPG